MAMLKTEGMRDMLLQMHRLGEESGEVAQRMILAGAEEVKKAWQQEADARGHRKTGAMIASVGYARKPEKIGEAFVLDIYPQGKDANGIRNAEKAFLLHYGTSRIRGDNWVDAAEQAAEYTSQAAMEAIWNEFITKE